jgi:hypothetical protein
MLRRRFPIGCTVRRWYMDVTLRVIGHVGEHVVTHDVYGSKTMRWTRGVHLQIYEETENG